MADLTRRRALTAGAASLAAIPLLRTPGADAAIHNHSEHGGHGGAPNRTAKHHVDGHQGAGFRKGTRVDNAANGFDPAEIVRDFDWGKTRRLPNGKTLREWELVAIDKEIEIAPGVNYASWTYNERIPGPTLRCNEGDQLRIRFVNGGSHPHTIHFHGIHPAAMDGIPETGAGLIQPGESTFYEFEAEPFGLHLYHCHTAPLAEHIAKGLYGAFIVDPKKGRPDADELVMVMNGFDTNFDGENEFYAVNTIPFAYMHDPIKVKKDQLVRIYLVNITEFDPINSLHVHANFFDWYPTGTRLEPVDFTDTVMLCQGQRGVLEMRFPHKGQFMFHAHQSEFAELGWMSFFEVE